MQAVQLLNDLQLLASAFVASLQKASTGLATDDRTDDIEEQCRLLQADMHSMLATASGYIEVYRFIHNLRWSYAPKTMLPD